MKYKLHLWLTTYMRESVETEEEENGEGEDEEDGEDEESICCESRECTEILEILQKESSSVV